MNSKILIISLHRVGRPPEGATHRGLFITPRLLSFEIWLLSKLGYKFTTLKDALLSTSGRHAVITFDDGYEDNLSVGLPVLEKYGIPATIFVVTSDVGKQRVVWEEAGEKLPGDMLSWEDLASLQSCGWEIGSHGAEHVRFHERTVEQQKQLISRSVEDIESKLGTVPISFAYPYGFYNKDTKSALRRSGIRFAVTTEWPGPADLSSRNDLLGLKRIPIGGRSFHHFVKAALRTLRASGTSNAIREMVPQAMATLFWADPIEDQSVLGWQNRT